MSAARRTASMVSRLICLMDVAMRCSVVGSDMGLLLGGFAGGWAAGEFGPDAAPLLGEQVLAGDFAAGELLDGGGVLKGDGPLPRQPARDVGRGHAQVFCEAYRAPASACQP